MHMYIWWRISHLNLYNFTIKKMIILIRIKDNKWDFIYIYNINYIHPDYNYHPSHWLILVLITVVLLVLLVMLLVFYVCARSLRTVLPHHHHHHCRLRQKNKHNCPVELLVNGEHPLASSDKDGNWRILSFFFRLV